MTEGVSNQQGQDQKYYKESEMPKGYKNRYAEYG